MKSTIFSYVNDSWDKPLPIFLVSPHTCVIVFGNNLELVESIQKDYPGINLIGAMSSGNISHGAHVESETETSKNIVLVYWEFEKTTVKVDWVSYEGYDGSFEAGRQMMEKLYDESLAGVMVFTEGLDINGSQVANGMDSLNKNHISIIGGLAADNMKFEKAMVYTKAGPRSLALCAIGFYGPDFKMVTGSKSGVTPFGVERKITKSKKNVLYELDERPALDVYEAFLGDQSQNLPASGLHFPVEISSNFSQKEGLLRTPIMINREEKTITFTGEIPQGEYLRLMFAQLDSLTDAAEQVGKEIYNCTENNHFTDGNYCMVMISCAARKAVLKSDLDDEINFTFKKMGQHVNSSVGFYAYGEIVTMNDKCSLVNQTMSQLVVWEK